MQIEKLPDLSDVSLGIDALNRQLMHVYQLLYSENMTDPNGRPLKVTRYVPSGRVTNRLKIYNPVALPQYGLYFYTTAYNESDEEILKKASMLLSENIQGKTLPSKNACCVYAVKEFCVCREHFVCPLHGEIHVGSHD